MFYPFSCVAVAPDLVRAHDSNFDQIFLAVRTIQTYSELANIYCRRPIGIRYSEYKQCAYVICLSNAIHCMGQNIKSLAACVCVHPNDINRAPAS